MDKVRVDLSAPSTDGLIYADYVNDALIMRNTPSAAVDLRPDSTHFLKWKMKGIPGDEIKIAGKQIGETIVEASDKILSGRRRGAGNKEFRTLLLAWRRQRETKMTTIKDIESEVDIVLIKDTRIANPPDPPLSDDKKLSDLGMGPAHTKNIVIPDIDHEIIRAKGVNVGLASNAVKSDHTRAKVVNTVVAHLKAHGHAVDD